MASIDDEQPSPTQVREAVALFARSEDIKAAIEELLAAGFEHADLSVLSSHESIEVVDGEGKKLGDALRGLIGEINYIGPLATAGFIAIASGPVGAVIAGLIAAGVGGAAAKEVLDEVTAAPHTEDYARSLAAGSVILWVRVPDAERERRATAILARFGGENVHVHERVLGEKD